MHFITIINTHTKKRAATAFSGETISILDTALGGNWATAGFDVLIVSVFFLILKELRLIDETKKTEKNREEIEMP